MKICKDVFGKECKVGDTILYTYRQNMVKGKIVKITYRQNPVVDNYPNWTYTAAGYRNVPMAKSLGTYKEFAKLEEIPRGFIEMKNKDR